MLFKLFSREYSIQYTEASLRSLGFEVKKHLPKMVLSQCYVPEEKNEACHADVKEWQQFISALDKKYASPRSLRKVIKAFHKYGNGYVNASQKIAKQSLSNLTNKELLTLYKLYIKILNLYSCYLWLGFLLNNIYTKKAESLLENKDISSDEFNSLLTPSKRTGILLLQDKLAKKLSSIQISHLLKQFAWMSCLDVHNNPWTKKDLVHFKKHLKKPNKTIPFSKASRLLTKKEKAFFTLVRELAYIKDMRDVYRRKAIYAILPLFDELAKRMKLSRKDIAFMTNNEILSLDVPKDLTARRRGFLIYWKNKTIKVETNNKKIKIFRKKVLVEKKAKQISGVVASQGKACGKVKLVFGIKDLSKVKKGNILVAVTTHPDFVPAMQKAAAIITNEGGLTSHAAIVSRELKVPCIVNTKTATKFFKDNDLVEVDAINGIVKKL
jgi:phosphoenolpyruvate synthase/pyruvate phosphate dikinase